MYPLPRPGGFSFSMLLLAYLVVLSCTLIKVQCFSEALSLPMARAVRVPHVHQLEQLVIMYMKELRLYTQSHLGMRNCFSLDRAIVIMIECHPPGGLVSFAATPELEAAHGFLTFLGIANDS